MRGNMNSEKNPGKIEMISPACNICNDRRFLELEVSGMVARAPCQCNPGCPTEILIHRNQKTSKAMRINLSAHGRYSLMGDYRTNQNTLTLLSPAENEAYLTLKYGP